MADSTVPFDLDSFKAKLQNERSRAVTIGGKTFHTTVPELLTDGQFNDLQQALGTDDVVAQARCMIDDYDGFVAAGGSAMLLVEFIRSLDADGVGDLGEGEASSGS